MLCFFKFFSFNWGIYSVSIELFKHLNLVIVVGPTSTLSAYTHTHTQTALLREDNGGSFVVRFLGGQKVTADHESCLEV